MCSYFIHILVISTILSCCYCQNNLVIDDNLVDDITTNRLETTTVKKPTIKKSNTNLRCPGVDIRQPIFAFPCKTTKDCRTFSKNYVCCKNRCLKGVQPPILEPSHSPMLGVVDRVCPVARLAEIFDVQECTTDSECSPRICCPETMLDGGVQGYCRTAELKFDRIPAVKQFVQPLQGLMAYMQCTPPPPPLFDVFPKTCNTMFDCFPNLCCQERGRKFCRPPRRSLLTLITTIAQRVVPDAAARSFINRIT